jgi:ubiquinone/menaquinone biosynthesis C-methylase UbiE
MPSLSFGEDERKVGIDISASQLERNTSLSEKILGDIQTFRLPAESFDAIICWDVLEHLRYPLRALENFARAVKPAGLIVLKLPNVLSLKGLATKFMPHSIHVLFYRYVLRRRNAKSEETGPFRTYLRYSIRPSAISRYAARRGLSVIYAEFYDIIDAPYLQRRRLLHAMYSIARCLARALSLGILGGSDFVVVLRKN